jgi:molecular chaperone GrpE
MDPAIREQLLDRFRDYLDKTDPALPQQKAGTPDLFSLLAELAALKNEVKIESRQVKTVLDEFRGVFDALQQSNVRLDGELARQREQEAQVRQESERDLLMELLDLRDRIEAGRISMGRYQPGWLARRGDVTEFLDSISEGQAMNLRRLDEMLARRGVHPLEAVDQRFDPHTMHAAETARQPEHEDGRVVGEIRAGFLQHERLLRPAEVIVNKKDGKQ